jgi:hypothetical protein
VVSKVGGRVDLLPLWEANRYTRSFVELRRCTLELQEFITNALVQIVAGIADARDKTSSHDATIGSGRVYGRTDIAGTITDQHGRQWSSVEFDVMLAEASGKDTKGGIGVYLGAVGLGSHGASHSDTETRSRIKFTVPIVYPGAREGQNDLTT